MSTVFPPNRWEALYVDNNKNKNKYNEHIKINQYYDNMWSNINIIL